MKTQKPILIDALHINMGGAFMILNHFVDRLVAKQVDFVMLKDERCPKLNSEDGVPHLVVMSSATQVRNAYYRAHRDEFHSVLCLGNIPPCIKMPCKVHTYFQNVSILKIPTDYPLKWKLKTWLKRAFIRHYARYTDTWVVQTFNTANLVREYLPCNDREVLVYPFYRISESLKAEANGKREDYCFIGEHTNAKGHEYLIEAWRMLAKTKFQGVLHLTCNSDRIVPLIKQAKVEGAKIENHGFVSFSEVVKIYKQCKATIYPSLNESLGLGIIEAAEAGCDVIGCDLPYMHSVCEPSVLFEVKNANAVVEAVQTYEAVNCPKTQLTIRDMADELIEVLRNENEDFAR